MCLANDILVSCNIGIEEKTFFCKLFFLKLWSAKCKSICQDTEWEGGGEPYWRNRDRQLGIICQFSVQSFYSYITAQLPCCIHCLFWVKKVSSFGLEWQNFSNMIVNICPCFPRLPHLLYVLPCRKQFGLGLSARVEGTHDWIYVARRGCPISWENFTEFCTVSETPVSWYITPLFLYIIMSHYIIDGLLSLWQ